MRTIFCLSLTLSLGFVISCHAQKTQERSITAFDKIKVSGAVNVIYTNSDTASLVVKGKESDLEKILTNQENGTLFISNKGTTNSDLQVFVRNNRLQSIESSGAASFRTTNTLRPDSASVNISGASDLHLKIETKKLKCSGDGAGTLLAEGTTDDLEVHLSSAASLKGYGLIAKNAVVITSGASNAKVYVSDKLRAIATSASDIKIKGDPKDVVTETGTAANITRIKGLSSTDAKDSDTTYFNWKHRKILVVENSNDFHFDADPDPNEGFKHWRGFSMAVNGYMSPAGGINLPDRYTYMDLDYRRSLNFQFNIVERQINIVKNNFKVVTGFGFDYHLYELANRTTLDPDSSFTWGVIDSTEQQYSYRRNKLRSTYVQVPFLFEFNTSNNPEETFHIAFGIIGQFLISSRTKQVLAEGKDEITNVRKDGYNMSPFAAKAHVNFGYRNWTIFGEYSLTPLFQSGKGPELNAFAAGIRVVPFS